MHRFFLASVLCAICGVAAAQVAVKDAWVRGTVAQQKATGAFMQITAKTAGRLVEVRSPVAGVSELHEMSMHNDIMRMRAVTGIDLPAGSAVELKPGGFHVMLLELKKEIADGQKVPLTLVIEHADKTREVVEVEAVARGLGAPAAGGDMHYGH
jgi:periplasmic copper chaperone A